MSDVIARLADLFVLLGIGAALFDFPRVAAVFALATLVAALAGGGERC